MAFIQPVFNRTRYFHGRIGNSGLIQIDVGDGRDELDHLTHFRDLWTRAMAGFRATAETDAELVFAPELLSPSINYGLYHTNDAGERCEGTDRWAQALVLTRIAQECWEASASP